MNFAPVIPVSGYGGWRFLSRTLETQTKSMLADGAVKRDIDYFREKIGTIKTADQLVADRRLLGVALGAFGLDADINSKAFIKKVLADGTLDTKALSNRLADKRYLDLSKTFGFGDYAVPRTQLSDFADKIIAKYSALQFEVAVGAQDGNLRLALDAKRELPALAAKSQSEDTKWYAILGSPPLRKVFETAFGLPSSFAGLDIDQQLGVLTDRASQRLGSATVSQFTAPEAVEGLIRQFLIRSNLSSSPTDAGTNALSLLQAGQSSLLALAARR